MRRITILTLKPQQHFSPESPNKDIGPPATAQYVTCTPTGTFFVHNYSLIEVGIFMINPDKLPSKFCALENKTFFSCTDASVLFPAREKLDKTYGDGHELHHRKKTVDSYLWEF